MLWSQPQVPPHEGWWSRLCAGSHQPAKASEWLAHPPHQAPCAGGLCLVLPLPRQHTGSLCGRQHGMGEGHHSMKPCGKEDIQPPGFVKSQRTGIGINTQVRAFPSLSWLVTPRAFHTWTCQLQSAGGHLEKEATRYCITRQLIARSVAKSSQSM